jgi:hypothetical protein
LDRSELAFPKGICLVNMLLLEEQFRLEIGIFLDQASTFFENVSEEINNFHNGVFGKQKRVA